MALARALNEPNLPWVESNEDRIFKWLAIALLSFSLAGGLVLDSLTLPEVEQKKLIDISPRLARLILEKQKIKPPPPKIEKPKPEEKKKEDKPKEKPESKPEETSPDPPKEKEAREVAQNSGLIALSDELADLREGFDLDEIAELPQQTAGMEALEMESPGDLLSSQANQSSGGINTNTLTRKIGTSELATRKTTSIKSNIKKKPPVKVADKVTSPSAPVGTRNADEVELVFQQNRGAIFSIYSRALRKNPSLAGRVVLELTIDPNGKVIDVKIISSELGDKKLERKLALRVKKFKFAKANVRQITVSYPIDFLPS